MTMTAFFRRLKFAFWTFFAILFRNRIPGAVAEALGLTAASPAVSPGPAVVQPVAAEATATQLLAVLQRDGRLVDFLMEDIAAYADAQIGAAVRDVHAGCRQAMQRYVALGPVLDSEEGMTVTVEPGTDGARVRLIGNVVGQPPFRGVLRHRGWLATRVDLPPLAPTARSVVAPAEVEIS